MLVDSPDLMSYDTTDRAVQSASVRSENYGKVFVREWGRRVLMAETKKSEINKAADTTTSTVTTPEAAPAAKTEPAVKAEAKTETKKEAAKETKAPAERKKPGRKPGTKTAAKKPGRKPAAAKKETAAAKKETAKTAAAKKTTRTAARKTAVKESLHLEFAGKSYTTEELVKIAKDVWKYDLKRKVGDFKSVELYVKPEESVVYYVINGDVAGNFGI